MAIFQFKIIFRKRGIKLKMSTKKCIQANHLNLLYY